MRQAAIFAVCLLSFAAAACAQQSWISIGPEGKLVYRTDADGNRIPDFSHCGYGGGGVSLPHADEVLMLQPGEGDMTAALQWAIDQVAAMPLNADGQRGAILLKRGVYRIEGTLNLNASGIVLRGEGQDDNGTILLATGKTKRTLIQLAGEGERTWDMNDAAHITDDYVPVGADSFNVDRTADLKVGQQVLVIRPSTPQWIHEIGMDRIPPHADGRAITQWAPGDYDLRYDRVITAIDGNRITLDAPIGCALEKRFGGGTVVAYQFPGRIENVGIENLRSVSEYVAGEQDKDEQHAWTFVEIGKACNVWVRNVTTLHFGFGLADVRREAKWVTVQDCACLEPVSIITGSRRYSYNLAGQLTLVQRCLSRHARHDYAVDSRSPGPNAFVNCVAEHSYSDIGPHHRWSTATLFDCIDAPDCEVNLQNRLCLGSGHGWSGANSVLWNCVVRVYSVQSPPAAYNWAIGVIGEMVPSHFAGDNYAQIVDPAYVAAHPTPDPAWRLSASDHGEIESPGKPVQPKSLYLAQLRDRLGPDALQRIAP